jgi:hypothetical protein
MPLLLLLLLLLLQQSSQTLLANNLQHPCTRPILTALLLLQQPS